MRARASRAAVLLIAGIAVSASIAPSISAKVLALARFHPAVDVAVEVQPAGAGQGGTFHCQSPSAVYNCYGPAQMRAAYRVQPLLDVGLDGTGKTIVIIDAFQNPTMASDLASFDATFGLPAPPSFKTIAPFGLTPFNPTDPFQVGWSAEIAIDVEWAHAIAPGANITLVLSRSDADADIIATERYVVEHRSGDVVSMSWGEAEACMAPSLQATEHSLFTKATAQGMTLFAASGDYGAGQFSCDGNSFVKSVAVPASDPTVTGVGGTDLKADLSTGAYKNEAVWNEPVYPNASGGGFSSLYARPDFQNAAVTGSARGVPDVAYSASSAHGVIVAWGSSGQGINFWVFGGTSTGAPQWAGICAIADQKAGRALGNINATLYGINQNDGVTFHDVLTGKNDLGSIAGYRAASGWDAATGLGSPVANSLVNALTQA